MDKPTSPQQLNLPIDTHIIGGPIKKSISQPTAKTSPKKSSLAFLLPRSLSQSLPSVRQKTTSVEEIKLSSCIDDNIMIIKEYPTLSIITNKNTYIQIPSHHIWLRDPKTMPIRCDSAKNSVNTNKPLTMLFSITELPKYNFSMYKIFRVNANEDYPLGDHYDLKPLTDNTILDTIIKNSESRDSLKRDANTPSFSDKWLHIEYVDSVIFGKLDMQAVIITVRERFFDLHTIMRCIFHD